MGMWPFGKQTGSERIRKDAGTLTPTDYERFPIWEFAIDEEGMEGQTECTVRPVRHQMWPKVWDYIVGARMVMQCGRELPGAFQVSSFDIAEKKLPHLLQHWLLKPNGEQHRLHVAAERWLPPDKARVQADALYAAFAVPREKMFPLTVQSREQIPGLPANWTLHGLVRAVHESNREEFVA